MAKPIEEPGLTIDSIENWIVPPETSRTWQNALGVGRDLLVGLEFIAQKVSQVESSIISTLPPESSLSFAGNAPIGGHPYPRALVQCSFGWYSVSACSLVRLIGRIAEDCGLTDESGDNYLKRVAPAVAAYRDKVGAHLAVGTLNRRDTSIDRELSVFWPVSFQSNHFVGGGWRITRSSREAAPQSASLPHWSLTDFHRSVIRTRFADLCPQGNPKQQE